MVIPLVIGACPFGLCFSIYLISRRFSSGVNNLFTTPLYIPGLNLPILNSLNVGVDILCRVLDTVPGRSI